MTQQTVEPAAFERARLPEVARRMSETGSRFLDSLNPDQRARASFSADHWERLLWHYAPFALRGLPIKAMDDEQRQLAYEMISTGMSASGTDKTRAIMDHEAILNDLESTAGTLAFDRDPGLYYLRVFGDPAGGDPWSWSVNGHHVYLGFTVVDGGLISSTPNFLGANPAEVLSGPQKGLRILGECEDIARELLNGLDRGQRSQAIVSEMAPLDIMTTNGPQIVDGPGSILPPEGLPAGNMNKGQQELLLKLVNQYVGRLSDDLAKQMMDKLMAGGIDRLLFAWAGGSERGQGHYFRLHRLEGGSFIMEHDNVQNDANHVHSVLRDADADYGTDILRHHYEQHHLGS